MCLLDQLGVHALFGNMENMWTERFGNYDCLVLFLGGCMKRTNLYVKRIIFPERYSEHRSATCLFHVTVDQVMLLCTVSIDETRHVV